MTDFPNEKSICNNKSEDQDSGKYRKQSGDSGLTNEPLSTYRVMTAVLRTQCNVRWGKLLPAWDYVSYVLMAQPCPSANVGRETDLWALP